MEELRPVGRTAPLQLNRPLCPDLDAVPVQLFVRGEALGRAGSAIVEIPASEQHPGYGEASLLDRLALGITTAVASVVASENHIKYTKTS